MNLELRDKLLKCYMWSIALYASETRVLGKIERKYMENVVLQDNIEKNVGVSGSIRGNGYPVDWKSFNKLSAYIMQDDLLQPYLTVHEIMMISANLKLGNEMTREQKLQTVDEVLNTLGLSSCRDTRTNRVSGGQRKRVSVALELVNNPPVIFLDEPTTGLDTVAAMQLTSFLNLLAKQGRTIICTIHTPTASLFKKFDHVYILGQGKCVYQGDTDHLVTFMDSLGLFCPKHYTPADFIMESINDENLGNIDILSTEIKNGTVSLSPNRSMEGNNRLKVCRRSTIFSMPKLLGSHTSDSPFATSFFTQFWILYFRMWTQKYRNLVGLCILLFHHLLCGFCIGMIFLNVGQDGTRPFDNFKFFLCVVVFTMYTYLMLAVLTFPMSLQYLKREYFNRWYGLKAYYIAHCLSTIPEHFCFGLVFLTIAYLCSDQPLEFHRFCWFALFAIINGLVSEGLGTLIGVLFTITNGAIMSAAIATPILALAVYGMGYGSSVEPVMDFLMSLDYLRYSVVGISLVMYTNREPFDCIPKSYNSEYCHYKTADLLLRDLGCKGRSIGNQIIGLVIVGVVFRILTFIALKQEIRTEDTGIFYSMMVKIKSRLKRNVGQIKEYES